MPFQPVYGGVTAAEGKAEVATMGKFHAMVSAGYTPVGCVASYSYAPGYNPGDGSGWVANPYMYNIYWRKYLCLQGKAYTNDEAVIDSKAELHIAVNRMEWIAPVYGAGFPDDPDQKPYAVLDNMPERRSDHWYFRVHTDRDNRRWDAFMITRDGSLPFRNYTRGEFLAYRKAFLEKRRAMEQKSDRDNYGNDPARYAEMARKTEKYYHDPLALIAQLQQGSKEELAKPAIIRPEDSFDSFSGFVDDAEGFCLIAPRLDYFNNKLPRSAVQYITVFIHNATDDADYVRFANDCLKAVDFAKLKAMIQ